MARRSVGGRGRGASWFTACLFPSSSGAEHGDAVGGDECASVFVVAADYQQQENTEISLHAGQRVEVIEKNDSGWWFVSTTEEQGWVPATYLISLRDQQDDPRTPNAHKGRYVTVQAYSSSGQNDLAFEPGVTVDVIQRNPGGWWFIRSEGKEGWAPAAYLRKVQDDVSPTDQAVAMETPRPPVMGQVEIIGNLMDVSNLLNKKPANDTRILSNARSTNNTHALNNVNSSNDTLADMSPTEHPFLNPNTDSHNSAMLEGTINTHTPTYVNTHMSTNSNTHTSKPSNAHTPTYSNTHMSINSNAHITKHNNSYTSIDCSTLGEHIDAVSNASTDGTSPDTHLARESDKGPNHTLQIHTADTDTDTPRTDVCASLPEGSVTVSVTEASVCCPRASKPKANPSPAIAWVTPQRSHSVENGSSAYSQKHPPRRENSLGFQLPQPPAPPCVPAEYYTIAEFRSCLTDGISFSGGQKAEVIEKNSGGWWYVQIGNKEGWAPCSYIDKRKTPSLNRRTSTLTRPKVPPPDPPIKKQNSLPYIESELVTHDEGRVYEEPEYDIPAVGLEFEFLPGDAKVSGSSSPHSAPCRLEQEMQRQGGKKQFLHETDMLVDITESLESRPSQTQSPSELRHKPVWDPPEYDAPTFEPHSPIEAPSSLQIQSEGSKLKPIVRPKPSNPDLNSLRRSLKPAAQPNQNDCRIDATSRTSAGSDCATSVEDCMTSCTSSPELTISAEIMAPQLYRSTSEFQQGAAGELSLPAGVLVEVLEKQKSGWWFVRWGAQEGWVPTYYLQPILHSHSTGTHTGDSDSEQGKWASGEKNELCVQRVNSSNLNPNLQDCTRPLSGLGGVAVRPQDEKDNTAITNNHSSVTKDKGCVPKDYASVTKEKNSVAMDYASVTKNKTGVTKDYVGSPSQWNTPVGTTWKNESLSTLTSLCSQTSHRDTSSTGRTIPVSMVKPKPHLIHNNLHEEYVSIADYHGDAESMAFPAGTRLEVLERSSNGWWYCRTLDTTPTRRGWVPSNFLEKKK